ncbi:MAG: HD domain-containing phosphohydrolase [Candidatus Omnitrophota bacterium]
MRDLNSQFENVKINPITLSFNKALEEKFRTYYFSHYLNNMRMSMILGIIIWGLFGIIDSFFAPKEVMPKLLLMRYAFVWPVMLISFALSFTKKPKKYLDIAISMGIGACGLGVVAKFAMLPSEISSIWNASLIIIFIYGYATMRNRFIPASITGLVILSSHIAVSIFIRHVPIAMFINNSFFLIMGNFIGMYVCYTMELFARKNFLHSKLLEEHRDNLELKVQERTKELHDTQQEIVYTLGVAAEYRDNETGSHIKRMSHYCAVLAHAIGMQGKDCHLLFHASQMHDIGKIGIPDSILLKPGRLTPEEYDLMKTHTTIGSKILSINNSKLLQLAQTIALTHHEKWDGSGYPNSLSKEEIPVTGRIVGLCDVFDALTSKRTYKEAWSIENAVEEIQRSSGTYFEPRLVEKFKELLPEITSIKERFKDPLTK